MDSTDEALGYTYVSQYKIAPSPTLSLPASNKAFSSAWRQRQVDNAEPTPETLLQRGPNEALSYMFCSILLMVRFIIHPPSLQFLVFLGVPLYPVLMTRFSRTRTQPTRLFMQLLLWAANEANCMKYWSQPGRRRCSLARSSVSSAACNSCKEEEELNEVERIEIQLAWLHSKNELIKPNGAKYPVYSNWQNQITKYTKIWFADLLIYLSFTLKCRLKKFWEASILEVEPWITRAHALSSRRVSTARLSQYIRQQGP